MKEQIHFQRSRLTWNFKQGDRVSFLCDKLIHWEKKRNYTTTMAKVTCPHCMKELLLKNFAKMEYSAEQCGLNLKEVLNART